MKNSVTSQIYMLLDGDPVVIGSASEEPETETESSVDSGNDNFVATQLKLTNNLLIGIIFFLGLIFGIIGVSIFFSRIGNGRDK